MEAADISLSPGGDGQPRLIARGAWTVANAAHLDALVSALGQTPSATRTLDLSQVDRLDSYGAWLIDRLIRDRADAAPLRIEGLDPRFSRLVEIVGRTPGVIPAPHPAWSVSGALENLGRGVAALTADLVSHVEVLGRVGAAFGSVLLRPRSFRLTSAIHHVDRIAWQAVPIIVLITFLIGCIIAQQGFFHFRKFGADQYVVDMVGILVVREIGVLLVAIMVAGRSGSSYTAELGSMKMREEIDAVRTMGLDPMSVLVLPRVLALVVSLPALTLIGAISALVGGGLVAWGYGDMNPAIYVARLKEAISLDHFQVGMIKAPFMALVIGIIACSEGLKVQGSAESLGLKTTASVVKSIFMVIVLDGLFAVYFASIGL